MPPLSSFLTFLPIPLFDAVTNVVAVLGTILITYAIFLEKEKRQDAIFLIGALCLLVYALWIGNLIFTIAMSGLTLASLIEMIEIITGYHKDIGERE